MSNGDTVESARHGEGPFLHREIPASRQREPLHPAWRAFLRFCRELEHGQIECLKIQDGLPVLAEVVSKKIKFSP